ncbi:hypothetical protein GC194_09945 [bacterium]|nr:hypothetical protein [bacterium]
MISTQEITLNPGSYFKLIARIRFKTSFLMYLLPFAAAVVLHFAMSDSQMIVKFLLVYGVVNPLWMLIYQYIYATSDKARALMTSRHYTFDNQQITAIYQDGNRDVFEWERVVAVRRFANEMLIYFSKSEFIYLPFSALETNEREQLEQLLQQHGK